ncbi:hypothetical protein ACLB2K_032788 [Fragaria x ananassa]
MADSRHILTNLVMRKRPTGPEAEQPEIETTFFDNEDPEYEAVFEPPEAPEGFVPPPSFDEESLETEDEIAAAYEELYGPAYSGMTVLGNDIYVMDAKVKKLGAFGKLKKEKIRDGFEERVVQVRRVTKVVKGGKQLHFRAIVVVGDKQGNVGVGVGKAKEVIGAVQKSAVNARRNIITVPMTKYLTFPHRYVISTNFSALILLWSQVCRFGLWNYGGVANNALYGFCFGTG